MWNVKSWGLTNKQTNCRAWQDRASPVEATKVVWGLEQEDAETCVAQPGDEAQEG